MRNTFHQAAIAGEDPGTVVHQGLAEAGGQQVGIGGPRFLPRQGTQQRRCREQDAARRDFTVNALYYDPANETVLDNIRMMHSRGKYLGLEMELITPDEARVKEFLTPVPLAAEDSIEDIVSRATGSVESFPRLLQRWSAAITLPPS